MPVQSMTGFGLAELKTPSGTYHVEIRGVNNRFLDIQLRQPRFLANLEQKIKKAITESVSRGSISVYISSDKESEDSELTWDKDATQNYLRIFKDIKKTCNIAGDVTLGDLLRFSDLIKTKIVKYDDKTLWKHFAPALDTALAAYRKSRTTEGQLTIKDLKKNISGMQALLKSIELRAPLRVTEYSAELTRKIDKFLAQSQQQPDPQRLATEIALMADRLDIAEECMRLKAHIAAFTKDFTSDEPVGKRMNFLVQEMNREANTIGSKANDTEISHSAVKLKEHIERIREQIQNIE